MKTTFNNRKYIQRQKAMVKFLTNHPDAVSMLTKIIICYRDKSEWILICNANGWNC